MINPIARWAAAAVFLLSSFVVTSVLSAQERWTPDHVAKLETVTSAEISPDGLRVAYTVARPRIPFKDPDGASYVELYVVDQDGKVLPYITGAVNVRSVGWTHDGKGLTFLAKRGKDKGTCLYRIDLAGGEARKILEHETSISAYSFSPKGRKVAFRAVDKAPKAAKTRRKHGVDPVIYEENLLYPRVWVADLDGNTKPRKLELPGAAMDVAWSPVDERLAVTLSPTPLVDDTYMQKRIHIVNSDSGSILTRIKNPGKLGDMKWSPDGKKLAFISGQTINDPSDSCLFLADPADSSGACQNAWPGLEGSAVGRGSDVRAFAWQNKDYIMAVLNHGPWASLEKMRVDGTEFKELLSDRKLVLHGLSLSEDGQSAAFLGECPEHPNDVFLMRHGDTAPKRLTNVNPWIEKMAMAKQEVITHKARDGLELHGILIHPLDRKEGVRYPLIMCVHGGPEAHISNGWLTRYSYAGQVGAARGFAVFYPNYRGSTGRGVAFSMLGQGDAAGKEFDDLVDAKNHLVEIGLVDGKKVGVTGGSYGGYATAWCATKLTEHFAAGVMFVGISNKISKAGTSDIPLEMYHVHDRSWPWEKFDFLLKRSPIYYVQQSKTPLLIMHGDSDPRVHPGQALEMHRHFKLLKKVVRLVFYRKEGHGNRRAGSRYDYNLRMLRWFEHYLKGPGGDLPPPNIDYEKKMKATG